MKGREGGQECKGRRRRWWKRRNKRRSRKGMENRRRARRRRKGTLMDAKLQCIVYWVLVHVGRPLA